MSNTSARTHRITLTLVLVLAAAGGCVGTIAAPPGAASDPEVIYLDSNDDGVFDAIDISGDFWADYYFDYASCEVCESLDDIATCGAPLVYGAGGSAPVALDFDCDGFGDVALYDRCEFAFCSDGGAEEPEEEDADGASGNTGDDGSSSDGGNTGDDGSPDEDDSDDGNSSGGTGQAGEDGDESESEDDGDIDIGDDEDDGDAGNGGTSSASFCSVSIEINGDYKAITCERENGEPYLCSCELNNQSFTCQTNASSPCSIPSGNCCGF